MKGWQYSFTAEGLNLERFAARAAEQGIILKELHRQGRKLTGLAREQDMEALAALAGQGGWGFASGSRQGAGRAVDFARRRWLLCAAMLLVLAAFWWFTRIGWRVEIIGAGAYDADVRQALEELQVHLPALRRSIDPGAIRDALEWRYPRVAWVECGWRGMTLTIRLVEGVMPEEATEDGPCDVVASRTGIVQSIVTCAGTPVVNVGDLVQKGQLLIRGEERTSEGQTRPVAARGKVYARIWESAQVQTSLYGTTTQYTGRTHTAWTLRCPWFDLWRMEPSGFAAEDIAVQETPLSSFLLPFTVHRETCMEAEYAREALDFDRLREENARAALQKLTEKAGGSESLVDKWINWSIINDEILLSAAIGERIADVAEQTRTSGMAAPE